MVANSKARLLLVIGAVVPPVGKDEAIYKLKPTNAGILNAGICSFERFAQAIRTCGA